MNVTLQELMLTADFSLLGSGSADRLCSTAEFPCHVRLAADVRPSHSDCEDKQVGRVSTAFQPLSVHHKQFSAQLA